MAALTSFGFRPGTSLLHRLDVRFKLLFLILISFMSLSGDFLRLGLLSCLLTVLIVNSRLPLKSGLRGMRFFFILLLLVMGARMVITPGDPIIEIKFFSITRQGTLSGVLICWRLTIIVLLGFAFVFSLKSFAFIPGKRIATMMGLTTRFIPVILNQANETAAAQRARLYRLIRLGIPLIRRTFERADRLAIAMEARCYSENRTDPELCAARTDWIALVVMILICGLIFSI
jgi:energy-coupling factor transporter transmembrane protein EcfT